MSKDELSDEARDLIKTPIDLYGLLGVAPTADAKAINTGFRKASLKYHPDKNPDNAEALEKFHVAKNAVELLLNPAGRAQYDAQREAKTQREAQTAKLDAKRRRMMEDLERAERGAKRKRADGEREEERVQAELRRLRMDGERRRREREEARRREREEEERLERERVERRRSGVHVTPATAAAAAAADGAGAPAGTTTTTTPVKPRFSGVGVGAGLGGLGGAQSAPSTPAGKGRAPAFSFSPKPAGVANKFEQDTLARLKAKQAEKRRLEEQIRAEEAETKS